MASHAHTELACQVGGGVVHDNYWFDGKDYHPFGAPNINITPETAALWSDDPNIWRRL